jgi:hypothetical protein
MSEENLIKENINNKIYYPIGYSTKYTNIIAKINLINCCIKW